MQWGYDQGLGQIEHGTLCVSAPLRDTQEAPITPILRLPQSTNLQSLLPSHRLHLQLNDTHLFKDLDDDVDRIDLVSAHASEVRSSTVLVVVVVIAFT